MARVELADIQAEREITELRRQERMELNGQLLMVQEAAGLELMEVTEELMVREVVLLL